MVKISIVFERGVIGKPLIEGRIFGLMAKFEESRRGLARHDSQRLPGCSGWSVTERGVGDRIYGRPECIEGCRGNRELMRDNRRKSPTKMHQTECLIVAG